MTTPARSGTKTPIERNASVNTATFLKSTIGACTMKRSMTFRLDADLLEQARRSADADNRSLTNYIETAIRRALNPQPPVMPGNPSRGTPDQPSRHKKTKELIRDH